MPHRSHQVQSNRHPWFYVPGRKDLTEKRISEKHERDHRRHEEWVEHNKYFNRCSARIKLLNDWQHRSPKPLCSIPPFDCDLNAFKRKTSEAAEFDHRFGEVADTLKDAIESVNEAEREAVRLNQEGESLISTLSQVREVKIRLEEQLSSMDDKWKKIFHVRVARDRLMHLVFLVLDRLDCFSIALSQLSNCVHEEGVFDPSEQSELQSVLTPTENIFQVMINLNNNRLSQFSSSYNEEAERCQEDLMTQWKEEDDMCLRVLDEIRETMESALIEKMDRNGVEQFDLLKQRKSHLNHLDSIVCDLKNDKSIWELIRTKFTSFQSLIS